MGRAPVCCRGCLLGPLSIYSSVSVRQSPSLEQPARGEALVRQLQACSASPKISLHPVKSADLSSKNFFSHVAETFSRKAHTPAPFNSMAKLPGC